MAELSNRLITFVSAAEALVWGPALMVLMLGAGVYLSICAGFPQLRHFGEMLRTVFGSFFSKKENTAGSISPFQAVSTALAGTVGTGNIAGVAGALALGGPGAIFWMWFSAFWGMATKYAEVLLAVRFREKRNGEWAG
ncbi:MAG: alanine:cation symporter family protein, partial [Oscillospiraceae bacterium]